jgi:ubiquinone/menaquinone biosynthesis C-methylase UbiE
MRVTTEPDVRTTSSNAYSPKEYWANVAKNSGSADGNGFAPVLHPGAPHWFNYLIDKLQFRSIRRALRLANLRQGARILDVGCGTGRWLRRYRQFGFEAFGVDATLAMLTIAQRRGADAPLAVGEAYRLPFANGQFDCVSDVTVVQHIPASLQPGAMSEMVRVLRPGGRLILMELICGNGPHIFPHSAPEWIEHAAAFGAKTIAWFGQEYLLLDRAFVRVTHKRRNTQLNHGVVTEYGAPLAAHSSTARRVYWGLRHITTPISVWVEPLVERIVPPEFATHGVFVFRKQ